MNIREQLEREHNKTSTDAIVNFVGDNEKKFGVLISIFLEDGEHRITQRAAWPVSYAAIKHPELITPYFDSLIKKLEQTDNHPSIPRNILRLLQKVEISEKYHGTLIDVCFAFIIHPTQDVAIRAFSITVAANICFHYSELKNELLLILNDLALLPQPPAIQVRIKSALNKLKAGNPKL